MKKSIALLTSFVFFVGCSTQNPMPSNFKVKVTQPEIKIYPTSSPFDDKFDPKLELSPDSIKNLPVQKIDAKLVEPIKPDYDTQQDLNYNGIPGMITVIYKNSYKVRLNSSMQKITSGNKSFESQLLTLLGKNNVLNMSDMHYPGLTEEQLDKDQQEVSQYYKIDFPHRGSIHTYQFPKETDMKNIAKEFLNLSCVRTVYFPLESKSTATATPIVPINTNPTKPTDPDFQQSSDDSYWWFKRHKVFEGWDVYGNTQMPTIAVLDTGFDPYNYSSDRANYLPGYSIKFNNGAWDIKDGATSSCPSNTCVAQLSGDDVYHNEFSHGTEVANVAASPKNNFSGVGTYGDGLCGIAPGANIVPIKLIKEDVGKPNAGNKDQNTYAHGIYRAWNRAEVDAINISMGWSGQTSSNIPIDLPMTINPMVKSEIDTAIAHGKSVVLSAGNTEQDLNQSGIPITPDSDAIIVGGTENYNSVISGKSIGWTTDFTVNGVVKEKGSNYGSVVDLAAAAYNVTAPTFSPVDHHFIWAQSAGTSLSAPMVAATVGMMRRLSPRDINNNPILTPRLIKDIVISSANIYKYNGTSGATTKFLGKNLSNLNRNVNSIIGVRDLNVFNALAIVKNLNNYQAITRLYNSDDYVNGYNSSSSTDANGQYSSQSYGKDTLIGLNNVNAGSYLNFSEINNGGGCSYGYQLYRFYPGVGASNINLLEYMGGLSGVESTTNCYGNTNLNFRKSLYFS